MTGESPLLCRDMLYWSDWFETHAEERAVARTVVEDLIVSTVFLAVNHNDGGSGPPVLWETMVFRTGIPGWPGGWKPITSRQCPGNREQALAMHEDTVEKLKDLNTNKRIANGRNL